MSITKTAAACILGCLAYLLLIGPAAVSQVFSKGADYPGFRIGAELVGTGELYNDEAVYSRQVQVFGKAYPALPPLRMPAYYLFLKPLVFFSPKGGENVWLGAIVSRHVPRGGRAIANFARRISIRRGCFAASETCGATLFAILYTQHAVLSALGLIGFQRLRQSKRPNWAGLVLATAYFLNLIS